MKRLSRLCPGSHARWLLRYHVRCCGEAAVVARALLLLALSPAWVPLMMVGLYVAVLVDFVRWVGRD